MPAAFRRRAILHLAVLAQPVAERRGDGVVAELRTLVEGHAGDGDDGHSENSLRKVAVSCGGGRDKRSAAPATCVGEEIQDLKRSVVRRDELLKKVIAGAGVAAAHWPDRPRRPGWIG